MLTTFEQRRSGCPVWHTHPAKDLLEKDVFGKHVHQEKSKQIQEPYWIVKRNKMARKIFADDAKKMATEWIEDGDD
eukprot:scaffold1785_cov193-Alexandrium_tamarense.AAC.11